MKELRHWMSRLWIAAVTVVVLLLAVGGYARRPVRHMPLKWESRFVGEPSRGCVVEVASVYDDIPRPSVAFGPWNPHYFHFVSVQRSGQPVYRYVVMGGIGSEGDTVAELRSDQPWRAGAGGRPATRLWLLDSGQVVVFAMDLETAEYWSPVAPHGSRAGLRKPYDPSLPMKVQIARWPYRDGDGLGVQQGRSTVPPAWATPVAGVQVSDLAW